MASGGKRTDPDPRLLPTPREQFLYLLIEMERLAGRAPVHWSQAEAATIRSRLARVADTVRQSAPDSGRDTNGVRNE